MSATSPQPGAWTEELCLLAPRQLGNLLDYLRAWALDGQAPPRERLAEAFGKAAKRWQALDTQEAGAADKPTVLPLTRAMQAHVDRLIDTPSVQRVFDTVPVAFGMVDLRQLVVSQCTMSWAPIAQMLELPSTRFKGVALARLCLPLEPGAASLSMVRRGDREFIFQGPGHDLRLLGVHPMLQGPWPEVGLTGHPQALLAVAMGASTNLLNVVRYKDRLILNNGHHRAFALFKAGVTHAPCLIQVCANSDDLDEAANGEINRNSDLYFDSPRPPMLKDFDSRALTMRIRAPRMQRQLRVKIEVERYSVRV
jgi:hypothetical protein